MRKRWLVEVDATVRITDRVLAQLAQRQIERMNRGGMEGRRGISDGAAMMLAHGDIGPHGFQALVSYARNPGKVFN